MLSLLLTILTLITLIYITREPKPMFDNNKHYKVSFNDLTTKDHQVKEANIKGDFGNLLEKMQEQGNISGLTVLESWTEEDNVQFVTNNN